MFPTLQGLWINKAATPCTQCAARLRTYRQIFPRCPKFWQFSTEVILSYYIQNKHEFHQRGNIQCKLREERWRDELKVWRFVLSSWLGRTKRKLLNLARCENNYQLLYFPIGRSRLLRSAGKTGRKSGRVTSSAPGYEIDSRQTLTLEVAFYYCEKLFQGSSFFPGFVVAR